MTNTLNAFIGTMGASSCCSASVKRKRMSICANCSTKWFHTLVNSREGRREAEALRGKLLQVI